MPAKPLSSKSAWCPLLSSLVLFCFLASPANCRQSTAKELVIPPGTVLPVVLRTSIAASKTKPGTVIYGKIAQTVPLPGGLNIRAGSKIEGQIVSVSPDKIALKFDKIEYQGKTMPIATNLRAIAGFMEIQDAMNPRISMAEAGPLEWGDTVQIGGDNVYGVGGPVMSSENSSEKVGQSLMTGGVLVEVRPNEEKKCRGAINGDNRPQALWVFSANACGAYGLLGLEISHAGRTDPVGTIVLQSEEKELKLHSGDGLLLRVIG